MMEFPGRRKVIGEKISRFQFSGTIVGIDASRCRSGGARAHLNGVLSCLEPCNHSIRRVHLWAPYDLLRSIPDYPWLVKHYRWALRSSLVWQLLWQWLCLNRELVKNSCDILFTADAASLCSFHPQVVLSQDLLAYEEEVVKLYKYRFDMARIVAIRFLQNRAFRRADGVIFLTKYAGSVIQDSCGRVRNYAHIPHGADDFFRRTYKDRSWTTSSVGTVSCLYISNISRYKNQSEVVKAIHQLRVMGVKIELTLLGGGSPAAKAELDSQIEILDPGGTFIRQVDYIDRQELVKYYDEAHLFIFASSCEAFGITLLEAMTYGIPIACSNRSCLPEILEDGGVYFDPNDFRSIATAINQLVHDKSTAQRCVTRALELSRKYSWPRCSEETFAFINNTLNRYYEDKF